MRNMLVQTLRWSEKYTKTDMVYLAHGGFWLSVGQIGGIFLTFLLTVLFANLLPATTYGNYKFVLAIVGIITAFSLSSMAAAITRSAAKGFDGALLQGFLTQIRWSFIPITIALGLGAYYFLNQNLTLAGGILLGGVFSIISIAGGYYDAFLVGKKKFKTKTILFLIRNTLATATIIATLLVTKEVLLILFAHFFSHALISFVFFVYVQKNVSSEKKTDPELPAYGLHLSLMNILGSVANNVDTILVFHFLGALPTAIYAFATGIPSQIQGSSRIISTLLLPKTSTQKLDRLKESVPRKAFLFFIFITFVVGLYIVTAPYIFKIFFPLYLNAVPYSQIFSLTLLALPSMFFSNVLTAHMRTKELYVIQITMPIVRITLLLILLPLFGLWGAIYALVSSRAIGIALLLFLFNRL
ncbi:MAG: oligosaccharide flippase family protein [Patescibacteria group bacterium UBA2103]